MQYLSQFTDYLKNERRYSKYTVTAYVDDVVQFFSFLADQYQLENAADVNVQHVKSWMYELKNHKISNRSLNRKLASLNAFYKYLLRIDIVKQNPLATLSGLKTEKRLPDWVAEKEITMLLDELHWRNDFPGIRDKLILELFYGTGIRLAELIGLTINNIDIAQGIIKVLGKRNKERIIPVNKPLSECIEQYMNLRNSEGFNAAQLLLTDKGKPLYPMFVYRKVKEILNCATTSSKTSPHVLRHTFATHLLNKGADINAIKELLGHTSLAATQVYTHNSIERLKNIYKQSHPKS